MEDPTKDGSKPSQAAPAANEIRPALRRILVAHPDTAARQLPADNDARVREFLAAHPELPSEVATGIEKHEIWLGMTRDEVVLSVGPATSDEGNALFYAGEGWLLRFDERGYLRELVER